MRSCDTYVGLLLHDMAVLQLASSGRNVNLMSKASHVVLYMMLLYRTTWSGEHALQCWESVKSQRYEAANEKHSRSVRVVD